MSYASVKNTAKNGKLIRAELRELVLAEAFCYGFAKENERTGLPLRLTDFSYPEGDPLHNVYDMHGWTAEMFRYYYNHNICTVHNEPYKPDEKLICFHDKKFRIYRKRLEYGSGHLWRLKKKTMQYFWTKAPLVLFFSEAEVPGQCILDFQWFEFVEKAYCIEENMRAISRYITEICGITNHYYPDWNLQRLYFHQSDYEQLIETVKAEALKLKQKLYDGCYIELTNAQKYDIKEGYDYGKKTRSQLRDVARRKAEKNQKSA